MRFDRTGLSSGPPAFVPVLYHVRAARGSASLVTRPRSLQATNLDSSETRTTGKWPWVFKKSGRCVDLPAEEVFSGFNGFEGLLFDEDDVRETQSEDDRAYSKVRVSFQLAHYPPCTQPDVSGVCVGLFCLMAQGWTWHTSRRRPGACTSSLLPSNRCHGK